jgi:predicted secreted acid phosphatase
VNALASLRPAPRLVIALFVVGLALLVTAVALAATPAIETITPNSADQITNLDVLRQQIKNYYGFPLARTGPSGTWSTDALNTDSDYAKEAESVAAKGSDWLAARDKVQHRAIVLDVDDTTLTTFNYELYSNWAFNFGPVAPPVAGQLTNADFVNQELFPAVPGMVDMVTKAADEGYATFFLTGRPTSQHDATLGNLTSDALPPPAIHARYPTPTGLFLKPPKADYAADAPWLLPCQNDTAAGCNTDDYKTLTRKHIEEDLGYEIVGNFGDQFSDLNGGFSDKTFKMPNPNYFLP